MLWSDSYKYGVWADIEVRILAAQAEAGVVPADWVTQAEARPAPTAAAVGEAEVDHHHEMVAFLVAWGVPHVHIGVTSSDIIDLEQTIRIAASTRHLDHLMHSLIHALSVRAASQMGTRTLARTHGQVAEPCSAAHLDLEHAAQLTRARADLAHSAVRLMDHAKLRGPTGNYAPPAVTPAIEQSVLEALSMMPAPSATQIAPRDILVRWAESCAAVARACHRVAQQIRLDAQSGIGAVTLAPSGAGSSSMPHKNNPVEAEQVCGLAGVVSALAHSVEATALTWGHRDLSNSSIERVVIPQIAAYTEQVLLATKRALKRATPVPMSGGLVPDSNRQMMAAQLQGVPYFEARSWPASELPDWVAPVDWVTDLIDPT